MKTNKQNKDHTSYNYKDYMKYIKNISYSFAQKSSIDIDDFISEAGLTWTNAMQVHNVEKSDFIAYFKISFRQACLNIVRKTYNKKNGGRVKVSLDSNINDNQQLHNTIASAGQAMTDFSDIALLSDNAKKILMLVSDYREQKNINNIERKKLIYKMNKNIKKQVGTSYSKAIQEICQLFPAAIPAKNYNTMPIIIK